jgi:phosphoglycolate phosphatase
LWLVVLGLTPLRFAHVVFDLDGTLVDSRADLVASVNHVLGTLGRAPLLPETLYRYVGDGARVLIERALGAAAPREQVDAGVATFMAYYGEHLLDGTRPYPGLVDALTALEARGVALSVLTNKPVALSRRILEGLGLARRFVDIVGGDSLPTRKPAPEGVEHLRALTGTARERMLLVGDSPVDVHTARAAGIAFCGVGWGLVPETLRAAGPERMIETAAELIALV